MSSSITTRLKENETHHLYCSEIYYLSHFENIFNECSKQNDFLSFEFGKAHFNKNSMVLKNTLQDKI